MKRGVTANAGLDPVTAADEQSYVAQPPQLQQQQPAKRVKVEEEDGSEAPAVRSQFAVNLVRTIDELDQQYQRAYRESRESLSRAHAAEEMNRTRKIAYKRKLEEAEQRSAEKVEQIKRELDESKKEAAKREQEAREEVASLTLQLAAMKSQVIEDAINNRLDEMMLTMPLSIVKSERETREREEQLKEKVASLTHQLEAEQSQVIQDLLRDRIDELMLQLDQDETSQLQLQLQQSQEMEEGLQPTLEQLLQAQMQQATVLQQPKLPSSQFEQEKEPDDLDTVFVPPPRPLRSSPIRLPECETVPHATNLLQLCDPGRAGTISLISARQQLLAVYRDGMKKELRSSDVLKHEINCRSCDFQRNRNIIDHFLSMKHASAMLESRAAVSLAAFEHWLNKVRQAVDAVREEKARKSAMRNFHRN